MKVCELIAALRTMPKYAEVVYVTHDAEPGTWDGVIECVTDKDDAIEHTGQARGFADGIVVLST
jgi:hypothetical protein